MSDYDILPLYDQRGAVVAYIYEGEWIYVWGGKPVGYLHDGHVYSFGGRYLGWMEDGWIRDRYGRCAFSTEDASGGPARPARHAKPARGARHARPARGARHARPAKPAKVVGWSETSDESFFDL
jgi:hypothetical protein